MHPWQKLYLGRPSWSRLPLLVAIVIAGAVPFTERADAIETGIGDPVLSWLPENNGDPDTRRYWFDQVDASGAQTVMIHLHWSAVAEERPLQPRNPSDPAYNFYNYDAAVQEAAARGLDVVFSLLSNPSWAGEASIPLGFPWGHWKPSAEDYGDFAYAVAKRYSGDFQGLPPVRYFEAWNEPNLPSFLSPQNDTADYYRPLLNALYDNVKSVSKENMVLAGATGPYGNKTETSNIAQKRTRPMVFLRDLLCIQRNGQKKHCPQKARFDILSHHAINNIGDPKISSAHKDDASSADMKRITNLLSRAEKEKTVVPSTKKEIWVSEFWINSNPPSSRPSAPDTHTQALWIQDSLHMFWKAGVSRAIYFLITDLSRLPEESASGAGLFYQKGNPKPAFRAFRAPLSAQKIGRKKIAVWTKRLANKTLLLQGLVRGRWRNIKNFLPGEKFVQTAIPRKQKGAAITHVRVAELPGMRRGVKTPVKKRAQSGRPGLGPRQPALR